MPSRQQQEKAYRKNYYLSNASKLKAAAKSHYEVSPEIKKAASRSLYSVAPDKKKAASREDIDNHTKLSFSMKCCPVRCKRGSRVGGTSQRQGHRHKAK